MCSRARYRMLAPVIARYRMLVSKCAGMQRPNPRCSVRSTYPSVKHALFKPHFLKHYIYSKQACYNHGPDIQPCDAYLPFYMPRLSPTHPKPV